MSQLKVNLNKTIKSVYTIKTMTGAGFEPAPTM